MDGEDRDDELERAFRERVLEPLDAQVRVHVRASDGEHRLAGVDPDEPGARMCREQPPRRLACAGAELEDPATSIPSVAVATTSCSSS